MNITEYIKNIVLDEHTVIRRVAHIENERNVAIRDLLEENVFNPVALNSGPYDLTLSIYDNRLHFLLYSCDNSNAEEGHRITLAITPFRRIIKDYFMICESYFDAVKSSNSYKVEAVDMGRRGIHNEGSQLLKDLLHSKIIIDFDTARSLFTLICVLHIK